MGALWGIACGIAIVLALNAFLIYRFLVQPGLKGRLPPRKKPHDLPKAKRDEIKAKGQAGREESCEWLNRLVQQIWLELLEDDGLQTTIKQKIFEELVDLRRTPATIFLVSDPTAPKDKRKSETYGEVHEIWLNKKAPTLSRISFVSKQTKDADAIIFADVSYEGFALTLTLHTLLEIPICVQVHLKRLDCRMAFLYAPEQQHTLSFCFMEKPKIDVAIETAIFNDKNHFLSKLANRLAAFAVPLVVHLKFTVPNMKTVWFLAKPKQPPYPHEVDDDSKLYTWEEEKPAAKAPPLTAAKGQKSNTSFTTTPRGSTSSTSSTPRRESAASNQEVLVEGDNEDFVASEIN